MEDLAPGVRFYPTEEELVSFYLHHKLEGNRNDLNQVLDLVIPVLDIYEFSPWELPQYSGIYNRTDPEQWFLFIPRQESEVRGGRSKRLTTVGYWKATGSPGYVYSSDNRCIAVKRTMVFYKGRAPKGHKTDWKMNEYKAIQRETSSSTAANANPKLREEFSLCRVYKKSKCLRSFDRRPVGVEVGPRIRAQQAHGHGATEAHQNPAVMETRSSHDDNISSSGDHGYPQKTGEESNTALAIGNESFLDWDQLENWYFDGDDI
ncbi:NAC domain-containing protein, putative [Ricinus communis]|uniref:NAC domain-containing protein, putative n=1 Tax=Ricinus communis TaxID=3988 RepID=B9SX20_RICCO|nr:NAC domain-containing protein, putative [Ricinus communis]|eukprot:XP_002530539.1 NAC domain-containing protein 90 [Ricinus communis]